MFVYYILNNWQNKLSYFIWVISQVGDNNCLYFIGRDISEILKTDHFLWSAFFVWDNLLGASHILIHWIYIATVGSGNYCQENIEVQRDKVSCPRLYSKRVVESDENPPACMCRGPAKDWSVLPIPPPGDLPNPGIEPMSHVSCIAGGFFTIEPPGKPKNPPQFSSVQSLSCVWLFATPWTVARQASQFITNSWSLLKFMSIESVMPSNHLVLCCPLLLLPSIFPSIRVFSSESVLHRWPKYWSFTFSFSPSNEYLGLISFRIDWLDLLAVQGTLKSLLQHHRSKASILQHSVFFMVQLSHPYTATGKTIVSTRWTFVSKVMSLLFNMLSRLVTAFLPRVLFFSAPWKKRIHLT